MKYEHRPGRQRAYARVVFLLSVVLPAPLAACDAPLREPPPGDAPSESSVMLTAPQARTPARSGVAAFSAMRQPNTVDARGPYRVSVSQLAGPEVAGGHVVYVVEDANGTRQAAQQADLRRLAPAWAWTAEIPGQPIGSTIHYHFQFSTQAGEVVRHPAHASAAYRFQVVALHPVAVTLPKRGGAGQQRPSLRVHAASEPSGELVVRRLSASLDKPEEQRVALAVRESPEGAQVSAAYQLEAALPRLDAGELVEFYFQLRAAEGENVSVPADAPARVYSFKHSLRAVRSLPTDGAFVLDVSAGGPERWIGTKGGGVWVSTASGEARHWGLEDGLPSGIARFALPDPVAGQVYVGTEHGVVALEPETEAWVTVSLPYPSAWKAALPMLENLGRERRAGPGALSPLDGTLLFQLQATQVFEEAYPPAAFLALRDDTLEAWPFPADLPLVGLSSASFDAVDGCWLVGGFVLRGDHELQPIAVRQCGREVESTLLPDLPLDDSTYVPTRIVAMARVPWTGQLVVGLEILNSKDPRRRGFGVYQLDLSSGRLAPLAPTLAQVGAEVTSLAVDWARGRLLVGTFGNGLLEVREGVVERLLRAEDRLSEITAIEVGAEGGPLLVGSSQGAFELLADETGARPIGPRPDIGIPADALPMDVDTETGDVLFASYARGFAHLTRAANGEWQAVERLRPGQELPEGLFGDAQLLPGGGVGAIVHSQGLLLVKGDQITFLGEEQGLHSAHLLRLLARGAGDIWVMHTPMPFGDKAGAALQILQNDTVARTVKVDNRNVATVGRWVEVPERGSVFAATRAGVVEISEDGTFTRLSRNSASSIARAPRAGSIGAVGSAIERWDGSRFVPVLSRVDHSRWPRGQYYPGSPIDLAIDAAGHWYLLYSGGVLLILGTDGRFLGLMDPEDGIPPTARRLLAHPTTGDIFLGSGTEGAVVISPSSSR